MIITINEETLTAVIVDDADAPTKQCVLGNWNPGTRKKWGSVHTKKGGRVVGIGRGGGGGGPT